MMKHIFLHLHMSLTHATGHKDRLNRKWLNEYSKYRPQEEMTAEFAAVLILIGYK